MKYTKKSIEKYYNVILVKHREIDTAKVFWTACVNKNGERGEHVAEGYTLEDVAESIRISRSM